MKTLGDIYGREGTFRDNNPYFKGPNHRKDHLIVCPECSTGMPFTDILEVRVSGPDDTKSFTWACPFCHKFIDHVSSLVINRHDE